ncbi:MAG TPA: hypothetical protein VJ743_08570 [Albitalea sp.]|nr:hypothetical protein [Albitalea sp.]
MTRVNRVRRISHGGARRRRGNTRLRRIASGLMSRKPLVSQRRTITAVDNDLLTLFCAPWPGRRNAALGSHPTSRLEDRSMLRKTSFAAAIAAALLAGSASTWAAEPDTQGQIDAIKAALPKFAIPMREVGDRFQNMYFAAKGGNWALAAYMSKYMNGALNPAKLTKPDEYGMWKRFYDEKFGPVNKAIQAKNLPEFEAAYTKVIDDCNSCHRKSDYGFIKVVKLAAPADAGVDYGLKSEPDAVPK